MEYQVTLFCSTGKYKPVSTIVQTNAEVDIKDKEQLRKLVAKGMEKICAKRYMLPKDFYRMGFNRSKVREYDKEKIEAQNAKRYAAIKAVKYVSGEWKIPTRKEK